MNPPICAIGDPGHGRSAKTGFTLLELIVALSILGILASMSGSMLANGRSPRPDAVARELIASLREARMKAMTTGRPTLFWLDLSNRSYGVEDSRPRKLPPAVHVEIVAAEANTARSRGMVRFFPEGGATGGRVILEADGRKSVIEIDWLDGGIRRAD